MRKLETLAVGGCTVTCTAEAVAATVTVADADLVASACDVAVTVTVAGVGTVAGAVYTPAEVIEPFAAPPVTTQVTAMLVVPETVAVNG